MTLAKLIETWEAAGENAALIWRGEPYDYNWLRAAVARFISDDAHPSGRVVGLYGDYGPESIAALFGLLARDCVVSVVTEAFARQKDEFFAIAEIETEIRIEGDEVVFVEAPHVPKHPLLTELKARHDPGLVLFSSGSGGRCKAVVHDGNRLFARYQTPRRPSVTIPFMLFDHIGGIHTLFNILSSAGTLVLAPDRRPTTICRLIEQHRVEVLPATPTFLNLLLLSDFGAHDLSSLRYIAYSAERMAPTTLARLRAALPNVRLVQNYGLSEVGILNAKSEGSDSLWLKLGGEGYQTRVRDGLLEIKAQTAMLGYLNAESPFTDDGWMKTGDRVDIKGDYLQILGRVSDIIIVGGEKVYPAEVEDLITSMDGVIDTLVAAEDNAITGQIVAAVVQLATDETRRAFRSRMTAFLADKLPSYKIPQKVRVTREPVYAERMKKRRRLP